MFDTDALSGGQLSGLMLSVAVLGLFLLLGVLLRYRIPVLKRWFIPASLIGGAVALVLGPHFVGLVPEEMNDTWSAMPGVLVTVVFAPLLMGQAPPKLKDAVGAAAPHVFYSYFSSLVVIGIPALLCALLLEPVFGVNPMFSTIMEISWPGGHGTAGGMAGVFTDLGWADGGDLAIGSATFGLLFGIFGGMVLINIAARRGKLSRRTGGGVPTGSDILDAEQAEVHSVGRISKSSIDNLAYHAALIAAAIVIGWVLQYVIALVIDGVPLFPMAMIGGLLVQLVVARTPFAPTVDKRTLGAIQGFALDLLVVSAVASVSVPVILTYFVPLMILTVVVAAISVAVFWYVSPRIFREDWFEHGIINFGSMTAVMSVGLVLLRTVDADSRTDAFRAYGLRAPFASPFVGGGLVTAVLPALALSLGNLVFGLAALALALLLWLLMRVTGLWRKPDPVPAAAPSGGGA
ncbi:sodium/glutamate symporter [Pseudonocardia kunmingensis]|uniref:ESS family glutamate:Na+ symporter n=1 Tax=Pseudonocardia kunmingensis TaxID=630975 RepID=A0A543DR02_9PSEU|nr:sodium/glutamate symporter [Pseudonocardia kunmingensis]TQM11765.1 ESS family glutamate:Na+ symporter [Pseudonocardia kunmingensis]